MGNRQPEDMGDSFHVLFREIGQDGRPCPMWMKSAPPHGAEDHGAVLDQPDLVGEREQAIGSPMSAWVMKISAPPI
jgi:hypothetical protein